MERNWNGTSSNEKLGGTERNEFQFRVGWNGTERVPKKSERSTTLLIICSQINLEQIFLKLHNVQATQFLKSNKSFVMAIINCSLSSFYARIRTL